MSSCVFYSSIFFTFLLLTFRSNNPKILLVAETSQIMSLHCRSVIHRLRKPDPKFTSGNVGMASAHGWLPTSLLWDSWGRGPENLWLQLSLFSLLSAAGGFRRQGRREPFRKLLQPDQPVGRQLLLLLRRDRHHNHRWALPRCNHAVIRGGIYTPTQHFIILLHFDLQVC